MKKKLAIVLALCLILTFAFTLIGCEPTVDEGNVLRIVTPTAESNLTVLIPAFTAATGIEVEYTIKATAAVVTELKETKASPIYDATWLPEANIVENTDLFANYVSSNNSLYDEKFQNTTGFATNINYAIPVILYNKSLCAAAGVTITGYESLLNASLKGRIAFGTVTSSSTYNHIENMLLAMGKGTTNDERITSPEAFDYVADFLQNLDKKDNVGSAAMLSGVAAGDYYAAMSYDTQGQTAIQNVGDAYSNVGVVFMTEGVVAKNSSIAIVKGGREGLAKQFADWMSSKEAQDILGEQCPGANPLLAGAKTANYKVDVSALNVIAINTAWSAQVKPDIVARFNTIYRLIFA